MDHPVLLQGIPGAFLPSSWLGPFCPLRCFLTVWDQVWLCGLPKRMRGRLAGNLPPLLCPQDRLSDWKLVSSSNFRHECKKLLLRLGDATAGKVGGVFKTTWDEVVVSRGNAKDSHTVRNLHFLSKNSTLISREKLSNCFGWNSWKCCGFGLFSCWQLWFPEKNCQKNLGEKLVKMLGICTF